MWLLAVAQNARRASICLLHVGLLGLGLPGNALGAGQGDVDDLPTLLAQVGRYVVNYGNSFTDLVAEEDYEQSFEGHDNVPAQRRRTRADIVFVALGGSFHWASFRDVFMVDGHDVRDRQARLEKLFLSGQRSAVEEAMLIRAESARYNVGRTRTVNEPTVPLMFLHPDNQHRFEIHLKKTRRIDETAVVEVAFKETGRPTMIRDTVGDDMPANGRFWIEPRQGAVIRSEIVIQLPEDLQDPMMVGLRSSEARIRVDYGREDGIDLWVPVEMRETYPGSVCRARYSNYRRFTVTTQEAIGLPQGSE